LLNWLNYFKNAQIPSSTAEEYAALFTESNIDLVNDTTDAQVVVNWVDFFKKAEVLKKDNVAKYAYQFSKEDIDLKVLYSYIEKPTERTDAFDRFNVSVGDRTRIIDYATELRTAAGNLPKILEPPATSTASPLLNETGLYKALQSYFSSEEYKQVIRAAISDTIDSKFSVEARDGYLVLTVKKRVEGIIKKVKDDIIADHSHF
jgi:hypothetical protein